MAQVVCPQTPWVRSASIRDNILLGSPYDKATYQQAIQACALQTDLDLMPYAEEGGSWEGRCWGAGVGLVRMDDGLGGRWWVWAVSVEPWVPGCVCVGTGVGKGWLWGRMEAGVGDGIWRP